MSAESISLTIDGREASVQIGSTVLQACESIGVEIPTLCTDPRLKPYGACRMCVVEIQPGPPRPTASCTMQAADGMTVVTNSDSIKDVRRHVIELQLQHHPLDCPYCDQAGSCELQDETYDQNIHQSPYETVSKAHPEEALNEVILINHNRCILCGRCVRMCDEQIGVHALDFVERGIGTFIAPAQHRFMDCERCGMCIETCPVGALLSTPFKHRARSWQTEKTTSICPHCSVGCSILVESRHGEVVRVRSNGLEDPSRGILCAKGFFGHSFVNSPERITDPLIRRHGRLVPVPWREAIEFVAERLAQVLAEHGPAAFAAVGSPNCTNEDNFTLQRFVREVIGSPNVYCQSDGFHTAFRTIKSILGSSAMFRSQDELLSADVILALGADIGQTHNVLGAHVKQAVRDHGRRLITATRLGSSLDRFASVQVRVRPGSEASFLTALAGAQVDRLEEKTGVGEAPYAAIRDLLAGASSVAVVWDTGIWTYGRGDRIARAAANLALGNSEVRLFPLPERGNAAGALLMGMAPDLLPSLRNAADETGVPFDELVASGQLKALFVMGEDVVGGADDPEAVRAALADAELVVTQDIFVNATTDVADVVLPGATFAEKGGHFTNFEGRRRRLAPSITGVGRSRPDWEIVARLAAAMGHDFGWRSHDPITTAIDGLWQTPESSGDQTLVHVDGTELPPTDPDTFVLATEQHLYTAGVSGRHAPGFTSILPEAVAELSADDATRLQIDDGDRISVTSAGGAISLKAMISGRVPSGVVSLPDRFLKASPRTLDSRAPDGIHVRVSKH